MTAVAPSPAALSDSVAAVRVLGEKDVPVAARLLARSFEDDPSSVAFVTDPRLRLRLNELSSTRTLRAAVPHACVYGAEVDAALAAVAIWHPPAARSSSLAVNGRYVRDLIGELPALPPVLARLATTIGTDARAARRLAVQHREAVKQASAGPSWHLAVLATDAAYRGRGLARVLLGHVLERCDADRLAAWLETTNPINPPIYERFGFETVARIEGSRILPAWWVMRRPPRT